MPGCLLAAFQPPLPLTTAVPLTPRAVSSRDSRPHAPAPFFRRQSPRAAQAAAPPATKPAPVFNTLVPYPPPRGLPAEFSQLVKTCSSIPELFRQLAADARLADRTALVDDYHSPPAELTFAQAIASVGVFTAGLTFLGLQPGDNIALFSENSYRWFIAEQAIMSCGAAAAVRGVAAPVPELAFIYADSNSSALFVEDEPALRRLLAGGSGVDLSAAKFVVLLFGDPNTCRSLLPPGVQLHSFDEVNALGNRNPLPATHELPQRTDVATLLYTSGTTGHPKGVVLSHQNLLTQLENITLGNLDPQPGEVFLSILPCWHVFERTAAYWCLTKGVTLVYSSKRTFRDDLSKYKPHILISVPRVFENLHGTIMGRLRKASAVRKALFAFFMGVSLAFVKARRRLQGWDLRDEQPSSGTRMMDMLRMTLLTPLFALANALIWRKIRGGLGGRLRICLSGGGSIAGYLEDFFESAGIDICVGYGMTETAPVIANRFGERNVRGSAGMPIRGAEVKIVDRYSGEQLPQGEQGVLLVRGESVFQRYWKNEGATEKAFDSEGYFDTGDLAYVSRGGDIVLTGRSKDLIVLSNGENIEPASIEDAVAASSLIDQVMLVGQDERVLGALVVPNVDGLEEAGLLDSGVCKRVRALVEQGEDGEDDIVQLERDVQANAALVDAIKKDLDTHNRKRPNFGANDQIVPVRLLLRPFSVQNGMMTQTLKVKKEVVTREYADVISAMYPHK